MSVKVHPLFLEDQQGKRTAVQLSMAEFEALMEERELLLDSLAMWEAKANSKPEDFEDWEVVKSELDKLDGDEALPNKLAS